MVMGFNTGFSSSYIKKEVFKLVNFFVVILSIFSNVSYAHGINEHTKSFGLSDALIIVQPVSIFTNANSSATFSIVAASDVDSYLWEVSVNGGKIWMSANSNGADLTIDPVTIDQNLYTYRCTVSKGALLETSDEVLLTVSEGSLTVEGGNDIGICGGDAQNYLSVPLHGMCNVSNPSCIQWSTSGFGYFTNRNSLVTEYVINQQDRGKQVVLTLSAGNTSAGCSVSDQLTLTVNDKKDFGLDLSANGSSLSFDFITGENLIKNYSIVPVKKSSHDGDVESTNYFTDNNVISCDLSTGITSYALIDIALKEIPAKQLLQQASLIISTTHSGELGSFDGEILELYIVKEKWINNMVTWNTLPEYYEEKISSSFSEKEYPNNNGDVVIRKDFSFDIKSVVERWYSGQLNNFGLLLRLKDGVDSSVKIDIRRNENGTDRVSPSIYSYKENFYVCKEWELDAIIEDGSAGSIYTWSGDGIEDFTGSNYVISSHSSMQFPDYSRSYQITGKTPEGCVSSYLFSSHKTPIVRLPAQATTVGSLTDDVVYTVLGSAYNDVKSISWDHNGGGFFVPDTKTTIQPTYKVNQDIAENIENEDNDFGKIITLETTVLSNKDCESEIKSMPLRVEYPLYPYAGENVTVCKNTNVVLDNASLARVGNGLNLDLNAKALRYVDSYEWTIVQGQDFGSLENATSLNPTFIPNKDMRELVICRLTVTSIKGEGNFSSQKSSSVLIDYRTNMNFGAYDGAIVGREFVFKNLSLTNVTEQTWTSDDANGTFVYDENTQIASFTPDEADLAQGTVTFNVATNCEGGFTTTLNILPPVVAVVGEGISVCSGSSAVLQASGGTIYSWSPTTGLSNPNIANPVVLVNSTTTYTVEVSQIINGEKVSDTNQITVTVLPKPEAYAGDDMDVCVGTNINLLANEGDNLSYEWLVGGEVFSSSRTPILHVDESQQIELRVTETDSKCTNTDRVQITVVNGNEVSVSDVTCQSTVVDVSTTGYDTYSWEPALSFGCANCSQTSILEPNANTIYLFKGAIGDCVFQREFKVPYRSSPIIDGNDTYTICPGDEITFNLSATGNIDSYQWSPSEGLSSINTLNPTAILSQSTEYELKVIDKSGCASKKHVVVEVVELPEINVGKAIRMARGDSYDFKMNNRTEWIEWVPNAGVSNPNGFFTTLSPMQSTDYTVTIGEGDCSKSEMISVVVVDQSYGRFEYSYPGTEVNFKIDGDVTSCKWEYGDGNEEVISTGDNSVVHQYEKPGVYNVCVTVTEEFGEHKHCAEVVVKEIDTENCD